MAYCRYCAKEIHETATSCPHCGADQGVVDQRHHGGTVILAIASLVIGIIAMVCVLALPKPYEFNHVISLFLLTLAGLGFGSISLGKRFPASSSATGGVVLSILVLVLLYGRWAQVARPDIAKTSLDTPAKTGQPAPTVAVTITPSAPAIQQSENTNWTPSFDCSKVDTGPERLICSNQKLGEADVQLSQLFAEYKSKVKDKGAAKREQLQWLKQIRDACATADCMLDAYAKRNSELRFYLLN